MAEWQRATSEAKLEVIEWEVGLEKKMELVRVVKVEAVGYMLRLAHF